jgi:hypothetical protein
MADGNVITPDRIVKNVIGDRRELFVEVDGAGGTEPWTFDTGMGFVDFVEGAVRDSSVAGPHVLPNATTNDADGEDTAADAGWVTFADVGATVKVVFHVIGRG